ncbi:hypothetical protein ACJMK2_013968 [Sinanodonta woodiana]|uniref:Uncharacterized protein n=1 Tax=Sinanodonta woodiana TaxID=1069815 RepID=A0ABD3V2F5_SINWO
MLARRIRWRKEDMLSTENAIFFFQLTPALSTGWGKKNICCQQNKELSISQDAGTVHRVEEAGLLLMTDDTIIYFSGCWHCPQGGGSWTFVDD